MRRARCSALRASDNPRRLLPSTSTSPASKSSSPERQWSNVVLPQPLGPTMATISPRAMLRSIPRNAGTRRAPEVYVLCRPRASTTGVGWVSGVGGSADTRYPTPETSSGIRRFEQLGQAGVPLGARVEAIGGQVLGMLAEFLPRGVQVDQLRAV